MGYGRTPLPRYRYLPGRTPHPRTSREGHSHGLPEPRVAKVDLSDAHARELYLFGVDLFNAGYFWESHEAFEAFWRVATNESAVLFFQGLIQVAAAHLKREIGSERAAQALASRGIARLRRAASPQFGLDVHGFAEESAAYFRGERDAVPLLVLDPIP